MGEIERYLIGAIPARAGETVRVSGAVFRGAAGGGTGLSPHGRGKRFDRRRFSIGNGAIPARAGETCPVAQPWLMPSRYPRTGGGNLTEGVEPCRT